MGHHTKNTNTVTLNRRKFIISAAAVGGGMTLGIGPIGTAEAGFAPGAPWEQSEGIEFTGFISIAPDNIVTVRSTSPDIGMGTFTCNPMLVTEELKCDWNLVRGEFLEPNRDLNEGGFYSSAGRLAYFSGRTTGPEVMKQMLQVGASARERLKQAAAQLWGVAVAEVNAIDSILTHTGSGRTLTYGQVASAAASITLDSEPSVSAPSSWTFLGKESPRKVNLPIILDGSAKYGIDVIEPGMVYAALKQSPAHGGMLKSFDADAVRGMAGVIDVVVIDPTEIRPGLPEGMSATFGISSKNAPQSAVAVIAEHYYQAKTALDMLPVEWDAGEGAKWTDEQVVYNGLTDVLRNPTEANVVRDIGDVTAALQTGTKVESEFYTPYQDHMLMEPLNATVKVTAGRVDCWIANQHPQQVMYVVAHETGVHPKNVHVHPTWAGNGFGRRVYGDEASMAAAIAKQMPGVAVHTIWTREENTAQGRPRDLVGGTFSATLGNDGMPTALLANVAGTRSAVTRALQEHPYQTGIPNFRVQTTQYVTNVMTGPWRAPVYNTNAFMTETFINMLADKAGIDPVEYRRQLLKNWDPSWMKVLDEVTTKAGWGQELPRGTGMGVAISNWGMGKTEGGPTPNSGTTVAAVVTAEVTRRGNVAIPRVDMAFDTGGVLNRDLVTAGIEGSVIMSLSSAMHEELNISNGVITNTNYDHYRMFRQNDSALPWEIHVHFGGLSGHERFSEIGEPPMGPPPPALAHAIFNATGKWVRTQPFNKYDLSWS